MEGWISIHRQLKDHWLYNDKPFCKSFAWIDLLLSVNHSDNKFNLGNQIIDIKKGSFITSEIKLSQKWGWTRKTVRNFLAMLEHDSMIVKNSTSKYTRITILNWESYQNEVQQKIQQRNNKGTTTEQQRHTNNNENNENNEDNVNNKTIGEKKIKPLANFEKIIDDYTNDIKVKEAITNFVSHRRDIKKPIKSDNTLKLILTELDKHTDKIAVINQSIMNCWQGLFELKGKERQRHENPYKVEAGTTNIFKKLLEEGAFDE